ncbi:MAG: LON peptidase substrate-binding domain-containing protein, partial [Patescibacteria group bacterium]|nr:LON peptidase substrate-binding domain-containing protein [Patescibacteria group bacterium]
MFFDRQEKTYAALVLDKVVIFPGERVPLMIEDESMTKAINHALEKDSQLVLVFRQDDKKSKIGVLAKVASQGLIAAGLMGVVLEGLNRVRIKDDYSEEGMAMAEVVEIKEAHANGVTELEALSRSAFDEFTKLIKLHGAVPMGIIEEAQKEYIAPDKISDMIASALRLDFPEKLEILEETDIKKRLQKLNNRLAKELTIAQAEQKIQQSLEQDVEKAQKDFFLRERLKAIEKELGVSEEEKEFGDLKKKILAAKLPEEASKRVLTELDRLKKMPDFSPETPYLRTYLEWVGDLPWSKKDDTKVDLKKAKTVLDQDHYGLEKVSSLASRL